LETSSTAASCLRLDLIGGCGDGAYVKDAFMTAGEPLGLVHVPEELTGQGPGRSLDARLFTT